MWLLAVGLTACIIVLRRQPELLPFLVANVGLGILYSLFTVRDPIPLPTSNRSIIGLAGFLFALRTLEAIFLGRDGDWHWEGLAAAFVGLAIVQLFAARRAVEREQRWWSEEAPGLGSPPKPESFREQWDWQLQLEARFVNRTVVRAFFAIAWVMTVSAVLGLIMGMWIAGVGLVLGPLSIVYFGQLLRLTSRQT